MRRNLYNRFDHAHFKRCLRRFAKESLITVKVSFVMWRVCVESFLTTYLILMIFIFSTKLYNDSRSLGHSNNSNVFFI